MLIGSPGAGGSSGLGWSSGFPTSGAINGARLGNVVASEDLTRAMVFTPLATAASGLTTIFAMAAWASRGNREMELVNWVPMCYSPSDETGRDCHVGRHGYPVLDCLRNQHGYIRKSKAGCGCTAIIHTFKPEPSLYIWSCDLLALGRSSMLPINKSESVAKIQVVLSAALGWAVYEYMQRKPDIGRRDSAETTLEYDRARSEKQLR